MIWTAPSRAVSHEYAVEQLPQPSITVHDAPPGPVETGLVDAAGRPIRRPSDARRIGYLPWHGGSR